MRLGWFALLPLCLATASPAITADEIVKRSGQILTGINDYTCLMTFSIRSADMRVPDTRVKIYFKKPDKFKPEAVDGDFAVLPKTYHLAIGNVLQRLAEEHRLTLSREQEIAGRKYYLLRAVPKDEDSPVDYHWIYVDAQTYTVGRLSTYPKDDKPVTLKMGYQRHGKGYLISTATIDAYQKRKTETGVINDPVVVNLRFDKYKVNVGLKDSIFRDEG